MTFARVAASADIAERTTLGITLGPYEIVLVRSQGILYALANRCTHAGSRLDGGIVSSEWIGCPLHGARFRLVDGQCISSRMNCNPIMTFALRETEGIVEIDFPD